jgi:hypothetical protein
VELSPLPLETVIKQMVKLKGSDLEDFEKQAGLKYAKRKQPLV